VDENLRSDFNSDSKVLNILVFVNGTFNIRFGFDVMPYDLVLTYKPVEGNCCTNIQGAKVNQIAENIFLFSVFLLSSISILLCTFRFPLSKYSLLFVFSIFLLSVCSQPVLLLYPFRFTTSKISSLEHKSTVVLFVYNRGILCTKIHGVRSQVTENFEITDIKTWTLEVQAFDVLLTNIITPGNGDANNFVFPQSVLGHVHNVFQCEFFVEYDLVLPISISNTLSFFKVVQ
jgi:hypothetical protein